MFYAASAMLLNEGEEFESHGETIGAFGRIFAKTGRVSGKFHSYFKDAFELREEADYTPETPVSAERARATLMRADEFVAMAEEYLKTREG